MKSLLEIPLFHADTRSDGLLVSTFNSSADDQCADARMKAEQHDSSSAKCSHQIEAREDTVACHVFDDQKLDTIPLSEESGISTGAFDQSVSNWRVTCNQTRL